MTRVAIVDYGAGNLASVLKGFRAAGADPIVVREPSLLHDARGIVVPGVGHFGATSVLGEPWRRAIAHALDSGVPLLGICLGMQWLYDGSDEAPELTGLGLFTGRIRRMTGDVKVPHVGWNSLTQLAAWPLLDGIREGDAVYFTHSYAAPITGDTRAQTSHAAPFTAVVASGRAAGMQFHPEKSGEAGLRLLRNWVTQCSANV